VIPDSLCLLKHGRDTGADLSRSSESGTYGLLIAEFNQSHAASPSRLWDANPGWDSFPRNLLSWVGVVNMLNQSKVL